MEPLLSLVLLQQYCKKTKTRMHKSQSVCKIDITLRTAKLESGEVIRLERREEVFLKTLSERSSMKSLHDARSSLHLAQKNINIVNKLKRVK